MNFILALIFSTQAHAAELRVAAAADLKFALPEIAAEYEKANQGEKVSTSFGASGQLMQQIEKGAPFDLFLSADSEKPAALEKLGKTKEPPFAYAKGLLVIWTPANSRLKPDADLQFLTDTSIKHLAVANPVTAPYGTAAEAALKKANVFEKLKGRIATAENISQTAQYVSSGAADVGLLSKSLATSEPLKSQGRAVDVSPSLYSPLKQSGVVLKGKNEAAALKFKSFLQGEVGKRILEKHALTPWAL